MYALCTPLRGWTLVHFIGGKFWILLTYYVYILKSEGFLLLICNNNIMFTLKFYFVIRGVLPLGQRARLWEKHRARSRKQQRGHSSTAPQDLQAGQSVTMKNAPMYQPGAVGKNYRI